MSIAAFIKFTTAYEFISEGSAAEICEGWFEIPDGFIYDDSLLTAAEVTQVMSNMIY
jgi:hypothetical protein